MRAKPLYQSAGERFDWEKKDYEKILTLIRRDEKKQKRKPAPRRNRSPYSGRKQAPRRPPRRR